MCGLFGFTGKLDTDKRRTLLRALCMLNQSRGEDSVGLASINADTRQFQIYRVCVPPVNAIGKRRFVELCDDVGNVWIGHTRYATRGSVSKRNAHPFVIGSVLGAHNGVVHVGRDLIDRCGGAVYDVDSQYLFHLLNARGKIGEISGSAALTFCELKQSHDVSLLRHNNPLHVISIDGGAGVAWSSELDHLLAGLALAGIVRKEYVKLLDGDRLDVFLAADGTIADIITRDNDIDSVWTHTPLQRTNYYCNGKAIPYVGFQSDESRDAEARIYTEEERYGEALERLERREWWDGLSNAERVELAADWNCEVAELPFYLDIDTEPISYDDGEDDSVSAAWNLDTTDKLLPRELRE